MTQIPTLIDTVKKHLKAQGKTYAHVAQQLALSEASVKRLFAEQNFTLQRLEAIAELLGYDLAELLQLVSVQQQALAELSIEQEQEIASDIALLLVTVCVMNHYTFQDILDDYTFSETECIRKLAKLDRLKIIELLPNNRIKLLIAPNFKWRSKGPIQQFFQHKIQQDFFKSNFDRETEKLSVLNGVISHESINSLQKKMQRLAEDFNNLIREDKTLPTDQRVGMTMVLAARHWDYSIFETYRNKPT